MTKQDKHHHQEERYKFPYHYLDLAVSSYKNVWYIEYLHYLYFVLKQIPDDKKIVVLDAGCGDARFCYEFKKTKHLSKIEGIDLSFEAIGYAKAFNPETPFYTGDLKALQSAKKYDFIILIEVVEHLRPEHLKEIFQNLKQHLKTGGKVIITVPSVNEPMDDRHYQHFNPSSLIELTSKYFIPLELLGHGRTGNRWKLYNALQVVGLFFNSTQNYIPGATTYFKFLKQFFFRFVAVGEPEKCKRLILIAESR